MTHRNPLMRGALILALSSVLAFGQTTAGLRQGPPAPAKARIYGRVTDFDGKPVEGADVELKTAAFQNAAAVKTGADGSYELRVASGMYIALSAVKDYQTKCLEYWAWNVPAIGEVRIDPRFDRLEVYALNAWRPQGAYPSYEVYFRPMSLTKTVSLVTKSGGMEGLEKLPLIDIAPDLAAGDIEAKADGERVDVLRVNKVREASGPAQDMFAYLIQVALPKEPATGDWIVLDVTLTDRATGERGEGRLYLPRPRWKSG
jgi:hypothetical protein